MGCKKLTYYESQSPLKVVYRKTEPRQKVVQRFLSLDPLVKSFSWQGPYVSFDNNPIVLVDPRGLSANTGWIKNKETGNMTWDNDVNTYEDFENSCYDKDKFEFAHNIIKLECGYGELVINYFMPPRDNIEWEGSMATMPLSMYFKPDEESTYCNINADWCQTFSTNQPNATSNSGGVTLKEPIEMVDGPGQPTNFKESYFFNAEDNLCTKKSYRTLSDPPGRWHDPKADITWYAQSSLIIQIEDCYEVAITIYWGFTIMQNGDIEYIPPTILDESEITPFHKGTIENLPRTDVPNLNIY